MKATRHTRLQRSRPTIGLLIGRLGDVGYAAHVWPGIAEVAEEQDANLICFVGGALRAQTEFDAQRNIIYNLISQENVDGLIVMAGSIGQFIGPEQLGQFYERFQPLPIVNVAMAVKNIPSVLADNRTGMHEAVSHLIEVHGVRRIAFVRGPEANPEAEQRFQTYIEVLAEHGIAFDADLVSPGNYLSPAGEKAVCLFLDQRKVVFDAIVAVNDETALGVSEALQRRGIQIPEKVRLVGFDDLEEARFANPPLTTVQQPLYQQGRQAAEILLSLLAGEEVPERITLPTRLVARHSCGCLQQAAFEIPAKKPEPLDKSRKVTPTALQSELLSQMRQTVGKLITDLDPAWPDQLLNAFITALEKQQPDDFLFTFGNILRQAGAEGQDVMHWQDILSLLCSHAPYFLPDGMDLTESEAICRQGLSLLAEVAQWAHSNRRMQAERRAFDFTTRISEPLMTAFDVAGLTNVIAQQLPRMGIRSCYLSLYEQSPDTNHQNPAEWSRLILAYNRKGRIDLEPGGRRFHSRQLLPEGLLPRDVRYAILLEPLHFRDEAQLGFILFEPIHTEAGFLREALSRQISTALRGALLEQERRQAQEALQASEKNERQFQEQLRTLLEVSNELSRAVSVDTLCRQAVIRGRERFGFDRLGIWLLGSQPETIIGTYGTDERGNLRDERQIRLPWDDRQRDILAQTHPTTIFQGDVNLYDGNGNIVGHGALAQAAMWDGEKVIGFVSIDNLLRQQPITDHDCELLNLYASTLGYLCTRKRAEEGLKGYSERLAEMVEERTKELRQAQEQLVRREKLAMLGQLAGGVGHELRNPLGVISNAVYYLQTILPSSDETVREYLGILSSEVRNAEKIVSDLLDFSRARVAEKEEIYISELIHQVLERQPPPKNVTTITEISSKLPPLFADPRHMVQILTNLVTNAYQAMPEGGELTIRTRAEMDEIYLSIADTGCGISPENIEKIFEPLFTTRARGIGLGLATTKSLLEANEGGIEVSSELGKGSMFTIHLPLSREPLHKNNPLA